MRFLTVNEVIAINHFIIEKYSSLELKGVKEPTLLHSSIFRPQQSLFGKDAYPSIYEKASALFESLALNHCFHNANNRTAFVSLVQYLKYNGYSLIMNPKFAEDFVVNVVNHLYTFEQISSIIKEYTKH